MKTNSHFSRVAQYSTESSERLQSCTWSNSCWQNAMVINNTEFKFSIISMMSNFVFISIANFKLTFFFKSVFKMANFQYLSQLLKAYTIPKVHFTYFPPACYTADCHHLTLCRMLMAEIVIPFSALYTPSIIKTGLRIFNKIRN